jgi:O-antigen ligase
MGPLGHSILFGAVCVWFGTLVLCTFPARLFGWSVAGVALIGVWFSLARAPLLGYIIAFGLAIFYVTTRHFAARWKVLGSLVAVGITMIFCFSGSPVATLMRLGGISPEAAWYRQAIWQAAVPLVAQSPIFGIGGLTEQWDYQSHGALVSTSVDAFWLAAAMMFGIPGSVLILLTMVAAFWLGCIDRSPHLSREEKRLSVALGIVITTAVFLGFTVHFWGTCWILLGAFSGMRANLAEVAVLRHRAARGLNSGVKRHPELTPHCLCEVDLR